MPSPGFLNENLRRTYPFQAMSTVSRARVPDLAIVDCGFLLGEGAAYDDYQDTVYLAIIARAGSVFQFVFRSTAPAMTGWELRFTRPIDAAPYAVEEVAAPEMPAPGMPPECYAAEVRWEGWLVTGDMAALAEAITDGLFVTLQPTDVVVEPALVQNLGRRHVRGISLANIERTKYQPDAAHGCNLPSHGYDPDYDPEQFYVMTRCLRGDVRVREGYNCVLRQDTRNTTLTFHAALASGAGAPTEEVPVRPGEVPPTGSTLLGGGPKCNEVITSINGIAIPVLKIETGPGIDVIPDPIRTWRMVIDAHLRDLAACPPSVNDFESSSLSLSLGE